MDGIELVASRAGSPGIRGIADLLANRFGMIWQGRRTASARHQTISSILDWSYNLLLGSEKRVLGRLAILVGEFTLEAACSVVSAQGEDPAEAGNAIDNLVAKSMISTRVAREATYYRLLDPTRGYALGKLSDPGERQRRAPPCN